MVKASSKKIDVIDVNVPTQLEQLKGSVNLWQHVGLALLTGSYWIAPVWAQQVTPTPGAGDTDTVINNLGPVIAITEGTVRANSTDAALFHSFDTFSPATTHVIFDLRDSQNTVATEAVNVVVGRVTGNQTSFIDGDLAILQDRGTPSPDLFLINPNGITFGANAGLFLPGSFIASTADSVVFQGGLAFSAIDPAAAPLLTITAPVGLQLGTNPGNILNQSEFGLDIAPEQTLGFVGGDITFDAGEIFAAEGRVELFAAADALVPISSDNQLTLGHQPTVNEWRDITLRNDAQIRNDGDGGGAIQIQGRRISLQSGARIRVENESESGDIAGDIVIYGSEQVDIDGESSRRFTQIQSQVEDNTTAGSDGSNILIVTDRLLTLNGGTIEAETEGAGNGGDITITANYVEVSGVSPITDQFSLLETEVDDDATGHAGNLTIITGTLLVDDGALLVAESESFGDAGDLTIRATEDVIFRGNDVDGFSSQVNTESDASGNGGDLTIQANRLFLQDGAILDVDAEASGNAGNVNIQATLISLSGVAGRGNGSGISVEVDDTATALAQGGNITLNTEKLEMSDGAFIDSRTLADGDAGNIVINAHVAELNGAVESPDGDVTTINAGVVGNVAGDGGRIVLNVDTLNLIDGATITTATQGSGAGGSIDVNAQTISISGQSPSGVRSSLTAEVAARASGQGGQINVETEQLTLSQQGEITSSTAGLNDAGQVSLNVSGILALNSNSRINSGATATAVGDSGDIQIQANILNLTDALITSSNESNGGQAGNVKINTNQGLFSNRSQITATTASGDGGNLTLDIAKILVLRNNSLISTTAGQSSGGGNGGNLTITAPFVVAVPSENSDIVANAFAGKGGNINIATQNLLGLEFRSVLTPESDITVSSQVGIDGIVTINQLVVNPESGLVTLPESLADPSNQITQGCSASGGNQFIVSGRGGVATNPTSTVNHNLTWADTRDLANFLTSTSSTPDQASTINHGSEQLAEATTWQINEVGQVKFTGAQVPPNQAYATCSHPPS
ncbi:beta strand repeat-containing protein [Leptothoe spongobia]|uniref:S-layer family protein n=1 Tax=Leptothoe spongobia TAU-MAC 1115 TaxID=1967444 RepID=A0A947GMP3_9CYAN|nr:S-layer family protein [Leptothoe spongobia]MBT9315641.1 S-layer family protein [Leptothoe spongobia TAU-MAC 1115]